MKADRKPQAAGQHVGAAKEHARLLARRTNDAEPLDRFLNDSQSFFLSHDYMAMLELSVAARTEPALAKVFHRLYREHRQGHDDIWIETLAELGYASDPRLESAFQWLVRQQDRGRWANRYAYNGRTVVDIEPQGQPSKWVTLRACAVLKAASL